MIEPVAIVSVSGGKDSLATALVAIDRYGPERVRLVFADTGHEHPATIEYLNGYLPGALGLPIETVRADFSEDIARKRRFIEAHWADDGVPAERIARALELLVSTGNPYLDLCMMKGRFPSRKAQFCTAELKGAPLDEFLLSRLGEGAAVESWQGTRRDESRNRRDALEYEPPSMDRPWAVCRPIVDWTAEKTVAFSIARGIKMNPLYSMGMKRVGCMPCINCGKDELLEISKRWPEEITRVREWENLVAETSKRGSATFFADPIRQGQRRRPGMVEGEYARIDEVVRWANTSRGGMQADLMRQMPAEECSSLYGLCE